MIAKNNLLNTVGLWVIVILNIMLLLSHVLDKKIHQPTSAAYYTSYEIAEDVVANYDFSSVMESSMREVALDVVENCSIEGRDWIYLDGNAYVLSANSYIDLSVEGQVDFGNAEISCW